MNRFLIAFAFLLLGTGFAAAAIESAFSRFYAAEEIRPIRNYAGGGFNRQGFRTVLTSNPHELSGHYFILKLRANDLPQIASVHIQLIATDSKEVRTTSWQIDNTLDNSWLYLGITGSDWPGGPNVEPVAWKIEVRDARGATLSQWTSFLWEMD